MIPHPDRLRVAAIRFLNPAPLLWDFEHPPHAEALRGRYDVHYTLPSACASQLAGGQADLGLVPIGALPLMPEVAAVQGCTIASLRRVRSIQLVLRPGVTLWSMRSLAADTASRSSVAYVRILLDRFFQTRPMVHPQPANLPGMLESADAALLIGDPALLALEERDRNGVGGNCMWIDVAELWRERTGLPWVAAVWAVQPRSLERTGIAPAQLAHDLNRSREHGQANVDALVDEWAGRVKVPANTIRSYLTENIYYRLNDECLESIGLFYRLAAESGVLPEYRLNLLPS